MWNSRKKLMSCDSIEPVAGFEACRNSNSCDKRNQGITLLTSNVVAVNKVICHAEQEMPQKAPV